MKQGLGAWGNRRVAGEQDKERNGATCEGACLLSAGESPEVPRPPNCAAVSSVSLEDNSGCSAGGDLTAGSPQLSWLETKREIDKVNALVQERDDRTVTVRLAMRRSM